MNNYSWRYIDLDPIYYIRIILRTCLFKIKLISRDRDFHTVKSRLLEYQLLLIWRLSLVNKLEVKCKNCLIRIYSILSV